jgi:hypothetical protein
MLGPSSIPADGHAAAGHANRPADTIGPVEPDRQVKAAGKYSPVKG